MTLEKDFFDLVLRHGLSPMEGICYALTVRDVLTPMNASEWLKDNLGMDVSNKHVQVYKQRGARKLKEEMI